MSSSAPNASPPRTCCWLMKAEPETRIVKGHDVRFSAHDFEQSPRGITSWEGVRSHQAKKILKEKIKLGDRVLFYASNTKVPGVTALAHCVKEGYPDHNAWDSDHPYHDPKSKQDAPTWFMVDLEFDSHLPHLVSLRLLQHLATLSEPPACLPGLSVEALEGIKTMNLLTRGRLSVQPVEETVYEAIKYLGLEGGFEELMEQAPKRVVKKRVAKEETEEKVVKKARGKAVKKVGTDESGEDAGEEESKPVMRTAGSRSSTRKQV